MRPSEYAWLNGEIVPIVEASPSIATNSFHMATGVFDGLMAYWNDNHHYLHFGEAHYERFKASCEYMDLPFPWSVEQLLEGTRELLRRCSSRTQYIRPIGYRGGPSVPAITWRNIDVPVDVCIFAVEVGRDNASPMACQLSQIERVSGRSMPVSRKACGVYVNSFLAQREAERVGFDTGLMMDRLGRIAEASTSNVFFIHDRQLVTPALTPEVFPGVTRRLVLDICERLQLKAIERDVYPEELGDFQAAFLCATLIEVRPISRIGNYVYHSENSPIFRSILHEFRQITHGRQPHRIENKVEYKHIS
jgi:branched-chain amino acid aminotransferase